jgi:hypothetical protein
MIGSNYSVHVSLGSIIMIRQSGEDLNLFSAIEMNWRTLNCQSKISDDWLSLLWRSDPSNVNIAFLRSVLETRTQETIETNNIVVEFLIETVGLGLELIGARGAMETIGLWFRWDENDEMALRKYPIVHSVEFEITSTGISPLLLKRLQSSTRADRTVWNWVDQSRLYLRSMW